mgnify:CR=1 FL=1
MSAPEQRRAVGQVKEVTSLANPIVKDIKALALKKFRDEQHAFMAEGLKLIIDALDLGWSIKTLVFAKAGIGTPAVEKVAARTVAAGGLVLEVSEKVLAAITRRDNPQMVVGVFTQKYLPLKDIRPTGNDVWVALDRVRDPGNLGTVIRTIDAVGAKGLILVGDTTDPFSLETVRATMGSIFRCAVHSAPNLAQTLQEQYAHYRLYGGAAGAAQKLEEIQLSSIWGVVLGSEAHGISQEVEALLHGTFRIDRARASEAESLNVAVAAGVILHYWSTV